MQGSAKNNKLSNPTILIDLIPDPVLMIDESGKITDANKVVGKYIGYPQEELVGKRFFELTLFTEKEKSDLLKALRKRINEKTVFSFEMKVKAKNGKFRSLNAESRTIKFQGKILDLLILHDTANNAKNQKRFKQHLLKRQEEFYGIANSIRDAIILVDEDAKITFWNPAAEKMFGYDSEEAIGKCVHDLVVPNTLGKEAKERITSSVKAFKETGIGYFTVGNVELLGRRKDGSGFPAKLAISPMQLAQKWHAVGVVKDITQRKQAEQKLKDEEQRYHTLFNQAPLGILIIDPTTESFVEFNDLAPLQLGYSIEEFEKLHICDIDASNSKDVIKNKVEYILKNGYSEFETKHRTKNGDFRNVIVKAKTLPLEGKTFIHSVHHDVTEMRQVQNALAESEVRYRQLVELAQEGIWALNNDLTTLFVNPRMAQMLGYSEGEMVGKCLFEFMQPDSVEEAKKCLSLFEHGVHGKFEHEFARKDGTYVYTRVTTSIITSDRGQPIGTLALVADITERKQMENELKSSEELFRAISTSAMDAIVLVDEDDKVIYWNPAAEKTFGFTKKEVVGKKLSQLVIPSIRCKAYAELLEQLKADSLSKKHFECVAIRRDGIEFPIDLSVAPVNLKHKRCLLALIVDVSERKAMEEALRQERDMLENVAANIDAGITLISKDYKVLWANKLLKQISGDDLENKPCYTIYDHSNRVCPDCGAKNIFDKEVSIDRHDYHVTANGYDGWIELIVTPVKDKDGKVIAALELAINITERKRLQDKLAEYSQKLEELVQKRTRILRKTQAELVKSERLAAIGELAGMVGHDLRNPLTGIKNSAYFLKKKGNQISEDQAKLMLETIDKCVDYSNKIVNDLLDYSREMRLDIHDYSLRDLLLESLNMIRVPENIEIINNVNQNQIFRVDSDKVKRVFVNLIKNAIDAMQNGGKLTIYSKVNENVEISFADTGTGISEDVLSNLFVPLFTTKAQGMGFGLAICKRVIEAHGGTITVKTARGKGTKFTVTLPIKPKIGNYLQN